MHQDPKADITSHIKELERSQIELAESAIELRDAMAEVSELSAEIDVLLREWRNYAAEPA